MTKNAQMVEKGGISSYSYKTIVQIPPFSTTPLKWLSRYGKLEKQEAYIVEYARDTALC